jgi:hypothetical protein
MAKGSRRPNRAAVTPIGQQNPPVPLQRLVLYEKTRKKHRFLFCPKRQIF